MNPNYLGMNGNYRRMFSQTWPEAPALYRSGDQYHLLSSGCSGWDPNETELASSTKLLGSWKVHGNPCTGPGADTSWGGQVTFVLPVPGEKKAFIAMFNRLNPKNLKDSG